MIENGALPAVADAMNKGVDDLRIIAVALMSIAISQKRQADSMDALGVPPTLEQQVAAVKEMTGR